MQEPASSEVSSKVDEAIQALNINSSLSLATVAPTLSLAEVSEDDSIGILDLPLHQQIRKLLSRPNYPFFQIALGGILGSILTLQLGEVTSSLSHAIFPFRASLGRAQKSGELLYALYMLGTSLNKENKAVVLPQTAAIPPNLQIRGGAPLFVDRFYLSSSSSQAGGSPSVVVVDRFYFSSPTANPTVQPNQTAHLSFVDRYYLPNQPDVIPTNGSMNSSKRPEVGFQVLPVPTVPSLNANSSDPNAHGLEQLNVQPTFTLLGVLAMQELSAALFRTNNNTYSVRLGESVGNSQWILSEIRQEKAILRQGNQTLVLSAGDTF